MLLSKDKCGRVLRVFPNRRWPGKAPRFIAIAILSLLPPLAHSVLGASPESGGTPDPGIVPEKPLDSGDAPLPPSKIDPGIQHMPEQRGDSRATVKPPEVDPGMSKNPDLAPPANKGTNPPTGETPQKKKPDVR